MEVRRQLIALTGGPGGGKSTFIEELRREPQWAGRLVFLPEAIAVCGFTQVSPREKLFQRLMVNTQIALEEALEHSLGDEDKRAIVCHRGSLDPLAYWLRNGWPEEEFYHYTGHSRSAHYRRYAGVIHLVTAALGTPEHYQRWPEAHRPELPQEAIQLDHYLKNAWSGHPRYFKIDNNHKNWETKSREAKEILEGLLEPSMKTE